MLQKLLGNWNVCLPTGPVKRRPAEFILGVHVSSSSQQPTDLCWYVVPCSRPDQFSVNSINPFFFCSSGGKASGIANTRVLFRSAFRAAFVLRVLRSAGVRERRCGDFFDFWFSCERRTMDENEGVFFRKIIVEESAIIVFSAR
jgi:hypothetical protein